MSSISINLFQTPMITLDDKVIHFPYKKAEALFYYMAIEKNTTREYMTELLWEENDESLAKKNLRHALYTINKLFPEPIIISPQKSTLIFNQNIKCDIDYDNFINTPDSINYSGLLLQGFYINDSILYDEWLDEKQQATAILYSSRLHSHLFNNSDGKSIEEIEQIADLCIKDDPLNEKTYKFMMEKYSDHKQYHKAINLYENLKKVLDEDLGLSPSKEISILHHKLLDLWIADSNDEDEASPNIQIRNTKLKRITDAINSFLNDKPENIIVIGENGIGKTYIVNQALSEMKSDDFITIDVTCFQAERFYLLQIWNNIYFKLSDMIIDQEIDLPSNYNEIIENFLPLGGNITTDHFNNPLSFRAFENAMIKVFQIICHKVKLVLFIDNITAMDKTSLEVLASLIKLNNPNLMIILTSLNVMNYDLTTFVSALVRANYLSEIYMEPLTLEQTSFFLHDSLKDVNFSDEDVQRFHNISSGNIFFLVELINNVKAQHDLSCLSSTAKEILNDRLNGVSPETRKLLDIISLFENKAPFLVLEKLSSNSFVLLDNLDEAKELSLIKETRERFDIYFRFYYHQMRDFIYSKIAPSKLRILHNSIGLAIEEIMQNTPNASYPYKELARHFSLGENYSKALYYRMLYLEYVSSIYFELYPIVDDSIISDDEIELPTDIQEQFDQLDKELRAIKTYNNEAFYNEMAARLHHAKSRYYVHICDYKNAMNCINIAMENPFTKNNRILQIALLKQKIYYCIQTCDFDNLLIYAKEGIDLAKKEDDIAEQAILLRLYGYYHMMTGDIKQAIASFLQSIDYLEKSSLRPELYTINIAAAYNYLGELNLRKGELSIAIDYFNKAIQMCDEKGYTVNATFYTNLGKTLFFSDKKEESRKAFVQAHNVYRHSTTIVGCSSMHAFLSYFAAVDGDMEHAAHHIRMSKRMYERINSPFEKGVFYYVMSELCNEKIEASFITKPAEYYKEKFMKCLKDYNITYFINRLD